MAGCILTFGLELCTELHDAHASADAGGWVGVHVRCHRSACDAPPPLHHPRILPPEREQGEGGPQTRLYVSLKEGAQHTAQLPPTTTATRTTQRCAFLCCVVSGHSEPYGQPPLCSPWFWRPAARVCLRTRTCSWSLIGLHSLWQLSVTPLPRACCSSASSWYSANTSEGGNTGSRWPAGRGRGRRGAGQSMGTTQHPASGNGKGERCRGAKYA